MSDGLYSLEVMSLGYVITEPVPYETVNVDLLLPAIEPQIDQIRLLEPSIRHPRQVIATLTRTRRPFTLPDGQVLQPPDRSSISPRKIAILGDCAGTDNAAFLHLLSDPSLLVHECTNAWVDPRIGKGGKVEYDESSNPTDEEIHTARQKVQNKAISRGHADAEMVGLFAKKIGAQRLVVNHFSAM
jgi:ribonuclease Z